MTEISGKVPSYVLGAVVLAFVAAVFFFLFQKTPGTPKPVEGGAVSELRAHFLAEIEKLGAPRAYAAFKDTYREEPFGIQHNAAHLFGESLYEGKGHEGVGVCDPEFNFGCYHGFFSKAVRVEGLGIVPDLDAACARSAGDRYLPCQHGIGHGVLEFLGARQLNDALEVCDRTNRIDPIGGCTSGVFMEYNVPLVQGEDGSFSPSVRPLANAQKPYDPCPGLDPSFQQSCYHELPQWWYQVLDGGVIRMGELCDAVTSDANRQACFSGVGNHAAPSVNYDAGKAIEACNGMPAEDGRALCLRSASGAFAGNVGDTDGAEKVCAAISSSSPYRCLP